MLLFSRLSGKPQNLYAGLDDRIGSEERLVDGADEPPASPTSTDCDLGTSSNNMSLVSLTLENSGSVARDHLASERTFLAYMRTSLALASAGVGLVQLFTVASSHLSHTIHRLHKYIQPLGAAAIVLGLMVLVIGVIRYFSVQSALTKGRFPVARVVTAGMALALAALIILTFGILLAGKLEPKP